MGNLISAHLCTCDLGIDLGSDLCYTQCVSAHLCTCDLGSDLAARVRPTWRSCVNLCFNLPIGDCSCHIRDFQGSRVNILEASELLLVSV